MPKLFDRVKVNTSTTGTGDVTFGSVVSNAFLTPTEAGCADTDAVRYVIVDGTDYEEGIGTIKSSVAAMARTTVTKSKISGTAGTTKLNLSGTAVIAFIASAADILNPANNLSELTNTGTAQTNLGGTTVGKAVFTAANAAAARAATGVDKIAPMGHLWGLTLSNNTSDATNDIDIATGEAADASGNLMVLASGLTKRLDASWSVGTNQGGLDSGSVADGIYYVWLIQRSDTGVVDVLFSASSTGPTMPTNYDRKRRIGAIWRNGGVIIPFIQHDDDFFYVTPENANGGAAYTVGTSRTLANLRALPNKKTYLRIYMFHPTVTSASIKVQSPEETDAAPGVFSSLFSEAANQGASGEFAKYTNSSTQIAVRAGNSGTNVQIQVLGWEDRRGRLS